MPNLNNIVYGYIHNNNGTYKDKLMFKGTPKNIASFITHNAMHKCTITDLGDTIIVTSTPGGFIDECPNQRYLQKELLPTLIPMQMGQLEPIEIEFIEDNFYEFGQELI